MCVVVVVLPLELCIYWSTAVQAYIWGFFVIGAGPSLSQSQIIFPSPLHSSVLLGPTHMLTAAISSL